MAHRQVGPLFAYVDDYGPHRWAQIVVDPRDVHAGPACAVALRRQPTTPDEAQRHLDAIPACWFAPAWERTVAESNAWWLAREVAHRAKQPEPEAPVLPEWPDETPVQADLFAGVR